MRLTASRPFARALPLLLLSVACGGKTPLGDLGGDGGAGGGGSNATSSSRSSSRASTAISGSTTGFVATTVAVSSVQVGSTTGQPTDIRDRLEAIPGMTVNELPSEYPGYRYFEMTFDQPENHDDPNGKRFTQRLSLLHRGEDRPTVIFSTGYGLPDFQYLSEPAAIVEGNQISVEHRFFAPSIPAQADWRFLNIRQSATDYHRITEALRPIYGGRWLNTGGSKGGMTSLYFRYFFPDDVHGTIAYVAPHSYGLGDPRYIGFLDQVGPPACRDALKAFQTEVLTRRPQMMDRVMDLVAQGYDFSHLGDDAALDSAVLSVRFLIWQYADASVCDFVPSPAASDDELWSFLEGVSPVEGSDTSSIAYFEPYYFQAATQLGDPGTDESYLAPLLTLHGSNASDWVIPGPTKDLTFDPAAMPSVQSWLGTSGERMLFIYGENDPWTAAAVDVSTSPDAYLFVAPDGNHGAGIDSLFFDDANAATSLVLEWAGIAAAPPPPPPAHVLERARLGRLHDGATNVRLRQRLGDRLRDMQRDL